MSDTATHLGSGKVRELYSLDNERLLLVASDRISTFDVVLPTEIPDKGRVLTGLSGYWFAQTGAIVPNTCSPRRRRGSTGCTRLGRSRPVRRPRLPGGVGLELQGDGRGVGTATARPRRSDRPSRPPATKAQTGHDANIGRADCSSAGPLRRGRTARLCRFVSLERGSSWPTRSWVG
jgi:hypothetical protein